MRVLTIHIGLVQIAVNVPGNDMSRKLLPRLGSTLEITCNTRSQEEVVVRN